MSRTIRRTGKKGFNRYDYADGWFEEFEHTSLHIDRYLLTSNIPDSVWVPHLGKISYQDYVLKQKELIAKLRAFYHADLRQFDGQPTSYRRSLNREFRRKNNRILHAALKNDKEPVFIPFFKNVEYYG